jgi:chloride channel 3/4/5
MSASPVLGTIGLSEPSSTTWRRERLLRIGSSATVADEQTPDIRNSPEASPTEHTTFNPIDRASYGTMPLPRRRLFNKPSLNIPHRALSLSGPTFLRNGQAISNPTSPTPASAFRDLTFSRLSLQRPIPAYDAPLHHEDDVQTDTDARVNGIRVWYSSFSSVDWLHDAIKDSVRFARLRRRTSLRARVRLIIDKSLGWFIVTIVGVLTALLAFLIVRSELWLFDTKDGYCRDAWWKAKRFCCPRFAENHQVPDIMSAYKLEDRCPEWRTWADIFSQTKEHVGEDVVEYISYAVIAVGLIFSLKHTRLSVLLLARSRLLLPHRFLPFTSPILPHSLLARNLVSLRLISPYLKIIPKTKQRILCPKGR